MSKHFLVRAENFLLVRAETAEEVIEKVKAGLAVPAGEMQYNVLSISFEVKNVEDLTPTQAAKDYMEIAKINMQNVAALIGNDNMTEFLADVSGGSDSNLDDQE